MSMNLKPFRDYDEHEVVNLFSTVEGDVTKGTFVSMVSFDPDNHSGYTGSQVGLPVGAHQFDWDVKAKVTAASTTTGVLGILLMDVVSKVGFLNEPAQYVSKDRLYERGIVPSGRSVPILSRGRVEIGGFSGDPYPGAKGVIGTAGQLVVASGDTAPNVGTFLSQSGKDGYAIFQVSCV